MTDKHVSVVRHTFRFHFNIFYPIILRRFTATLKTCTVHWLRMRITQVYLVYFFSKYSHEKKKKGIFQQKIHHQNPVYVETVQYY